MLPLTKGHKKEEHLFVGWQELKAMKLKPHLSQSPPK